MRSPSNCANIRAKRFVHQPYPSRRCSDHRYSGCPQSCPSALKSSGAAPLTTRHVPSALSVNNPGCRHTSDESCDTKIGRSPISPTPFWFAYARSARHCRSATNCANRKNATSSRRSSRACASAAGRRLRSPASHCHQGLRPRDSRIAKTAHHLPATPPAPCRNDRTRPGPSAPQKTAPPHDADAPCETPPPHESPHGPPAYPPTASRPPDSASLLCARVRARSTTGSPQTPRTRCTGCPPHQSAPSATSATKTAPPAPTNPPSQTPPPPGPRSHEAPADSSDATTPHHDDPQTNTPSQPCKQSSPKDTRL